jgi:WD repeat-containing protein 35
LDKNDFVVAEKCFVRCRDYQGIQFVKRLRLMDDPHKQRAEILIYFTKFDEAEKIFKEMDRKDLAAEMRMRLGDWFKVVQLVQEGGGDDSLVQYAWDQIGDYYCERQKWTKAVQYYSQAKKYEKLVPLYFLLEDYRSLTRVIDFVDHDVPLLTEIGRKLASVGLSENAVEAFIKAQEIKMAVDSCVELNQWDQAIQLAEKYRVSEIAQYLGKYATHLVEKDKVAQAIELYKRAGRYLDSAKLMVQLAQKATDPLRAKKLYVLSALDVEKFKRKQLDTTRRTSQLVDGLLQTENATGLDKSLQSPWHGAEAYHFYMLCQRQFYDNNIEGALITASRLPMYDDVLDEIDVYSILALLAFYARNFGICSKAFVRLEAIENGGGKDAKDVSAPVALDDTLDLVKSNVTASLRAMTSLAGSNSLNNIMLSDILGDNARKYQDLAVKIFSKNPPVDTGTANNQCPNKLKGDQKCGAPMKDWMSTCPSCGGNVPVCVTTGKSIFGRSVVCRMCKHHSIEFELNKLRNCPLCHTPRDGLREGAVPRS